MNSQTSSGSKKTYLRVAALEKWLRIRYPAASAVTKDGQVSIHIADKELVGGLKLIGDDSVGLDDIGQLLRMIECSTEEKLSPEMQAILAYVDRLSRMTAYTTIWDLSLSVSKILGVKIVVDMKNIATGFGPKGAPVQRVPFTIGDKPIMTLTCSGQGYRTGTFLYRAAEELILSSLDAVMLAKICRAWKL